MAEIIESKDLSEIICRDSGEGCVVSSFDGHAGKLMDVRKISWPCVCFGGGVV